MSLGIFLEECPEGGKHWGMSCENVRIPSWNGIRETWSPYWRQNNYAELCLLSGWPLSALTLDQVPSGTAVVPHSPLTLCSPKLFFQVVIGSGALLSSRLVALKSL